MSDICPGTYVGYMTLDICRIYDPGHMSDICPGTYVGYVCPTYILLGFSAQVQLGNTGCRLDRGGLLFMYCRWFNGGRCIEDLSDGGLS